MTTKVGIIIETIQFAIDCAVEAINWCHMNTRNAV